MANTAINSNQLPKETPRRAWSCREIAAQYGLSLRMVRMLAAAGAFGPVLEVGRRRLITEAGRLSFEQAKQRKAG